MSIRSRILGSDDAVDEAAALAEFAEQRDAEQEGHADRGEMAVGGAVLAFVEPVGVDHRHRSCGSEVEHW